MKYKYEGNYDRYIDPESDWYFDVIDSGVVEEHEMFDLKDGTVLELVVAKGKTYIYHEVTTRLM